MNTHTIKALLFAGLLLTATGCQARTPLWQAFKNKFSIGAAVNARQVRSSDPELQQLIASEFDCLVAEDCMKGEVVSPAEGQWNFRDADRLVELCEKNGQDCYGHCLVWHSQPPHWFFRNEDGSRWTREQCIHYMQAHIRNVAGRYKGRIKAWDVVNEALNDDGSFRRSPYYEIIGEDYFEIAFRTAQEADPEAMLFYNDYSMDKPAKREAAIRLVKKLREKGCRVDGVGMQSHMGLDSDLKEYEATIAALEKAGCKVMVTELDLSMLPWPYGNQGADISQNYAYRAELNPYTDGLTKEAEQQQTDFYSRLFEIYLRHSDAIIRVNFWGVTDGDSWKNNWPVKGRTDHPLAFDRQGKAKPFVKAIKKMAKKAGGGK